MGNQLTGVAPSQILPVEHYLSDNTEYEYESSLGSTRFFKVARAKCKEGLAVVKVFVIHDPSLPLERHRQRLEEIAVRLKTASNCLPFQKSVQLERSALLFRQYVKYSLYDRMSTRPFLISIEKRWIAFQLLCALNQCHKLKVCHGDIKSENVMLTSWNWVLLTDFASFKPAFLPEDNPSDFSYFFDSSRRRTCYIAPERFVESSVLNAEGDLNLTEEKTGELNPKMDIFSVGCVITELFTDGIPPFDLSRLLSYRSGDYSPWKVIDSIQGHAHIKELVSHMLQKDPEHRLSAEEYLVKQRGKAFPDVFYTYLKMFEQQYYVDNIYPSDDRIMLLMRDYDLIMKHLQVKEDRPEANDVLVILVSLVGSVCRNLSFAHHRELALDLLYKLSQNLTVDLMLNRIVPLILFFLSDTYAEVRAKAVRTLACVLSPVTEVPESEANIFSEYIFPALNPIVTDEESIVRLEYARNIAALAEAAFRVLESTHQLRMSEQERQLAEQEEEDTAVEEEEADDDESLQEFAEQSYDSELQALQETIQHKVVTLLSDPNNSVKMTLIDNDIGRLCHFFGRQKASDVLLSHMITFLNDKQDWQLRASFFVAITSVASYVGWQSAQILKPLLQQGLSDSEEFVIQKTLSSLQKLVYFGFIYKSVLLEFVTDIAPLLAHPNDWIRQGSAGFISSVASIMDVADLHVKLLPQVKPFLRLPVIQLKDQMILLNALGEPLPRSVYDCILRSQQVEQVYEMLRSREIARNNRYRSLYNDEHDTMSQLLRKLQHLGMTESHEVKLLAMKDFILKVHRARAGSAESSSGEGDDQHKSGVINIRHLGYVITRRHADLYKSKDATTEANAVTKSHKKKQQKTETPTAMNAEWRKMFGTDDSDQSSLDSPVKGRPMTGTEKVGDSLDGKKMNPPPTSLPPPMPTSGGGGSNAMTGHQPLLMEPGMPLLSMSNKPVQSRFAQCKWDLRNCVHHLRRRFDTEVMSRDLVEGIMWDSRPPPDNWRPKGVLVAHLQEHRGAVNRLCVSPDHKFFASCSNDSTVRLWEVSRLEGKTAANRSQLVFNKQSGCIKCLTFCGSSRRLAAASDLGSLNVYQLDAEGGPSKDTLDYDKENKGAIMDLAYFDTGAQSILTFATVHGYIVGWDLRCKEPAWVLKHDTRMGVITALAVHKTQSWMGVGTSVGNHNVWDLRFMLSIAAPTIRHRAKKRVRRIVMHPQKPSWFASAVEWNNEVSMWNVESMMRQEMLWASPYPPFTEMENSGHSVRGLYLASTDTHTFALTGGTDKCIRYWDLKCPAKSFVMSHGTDAPTCVSYRSQLIDGCEVTQEVKTNQALSQRDREEVPSRVSFHDAPPTGHIDAISDITLCQASQCLVVSASYNGHIKVWK